MSLPRATGQIRHLADQALSWWLAELSALLPNTARRLAASVWPPELVLGFGSVSATLIDAARAGFGKASIPIDCEVAHSDVARARTITNTNVRILLGDDKVFQTKTELPAAAESTMSQILFHQLERLVPLDPNKISFAWRIIEHIPSRKALSVAVTIVKNDTIDEAIGFAQQFGLTPTAIVVKQEDGTETAVWRGLSNTKHRLARWLHRGIEVAALCAFVLAYSTSIARLELERARLTQELQIAQSQMGALDVAKKHLLKTEFMLHSVMARLAEPTPLAVLDAATKAMPLDASVSEFDFKPTQISLVGNASHTSALLNLPSRSAIFVDAQFSAPLTAAPGGTGEHFEMNLRLRKQEP